MPQCAFCPHSAKLSAEHIWSDWMRGLFASKQFHCVQRNEDNEVVGHWVKPSIDFRAKVVCKPCSEGWMSNLESQRAKPAMSELIVGKCDIPIKQKRAHAIALFAFKTAVVLDHAARRDAPFFSEDVRYSFARTLKLPETVQMWFAGYLPKGSGRLVSYYYENPANTFSGLKGYVCTFAVGHFVFQTVAIDYSGPSFTFAPERRFESLSVPFWPLVPKGFMWPAGDVLRTVEQFESFADRWKNISLIRHR